MVYLCTALAGRGYAPELVDLSGRIGFYDPPDDLWATCDSDAWRNPDSIRHGEWMDGYLPEPDARGEITFFSAQFSPDVVFHARHAHNIKVRDPQAVTAIGGAALTGLRPEQLRLLARFFDHVLVGYDVERLLAEVFDGRRRPNGSGRITKAMDAPIFRPDYSLLPPEDFVTVFTGHGCYYGGCRFCDFPARSDGRVRFREPSQVAEEVRSILRLKPDVRDVFLTQDSYTRDHLHRTAREIERLCGTAPYSIMVRAEPWVREEIGEALARSGCVDVFMGAEGLDDEILAQLNKGLKVDDICNAVRAISRYVNVTIGMILFVPGISDRARTSQLRRLESILPYLDGIELEVLTVVNGSEFARRPSRYGIVLNATENILNDSWCFGLSQDIPWTMADPAEIPKWLKHAEDLKSLCGELVAPVYWESLRRLAGDLGYDIRV